MKESTLIIIVVLMAIFLSSFPVNAYSAENNAIKSFDIKPSVCVIERRSNCQYQFIFSWELFYATQVCLSTDDTEETLICSSELKREVGLNVNLENSTDYNLIVVDHPQYKQTRSIDVQRLGVDSRILQRRIWSVF